MIAASSELRHTPGISGSVFLRGTKFVLLGFYSELPKLRWYFFLYYVRYVKTCSQGSFKSHQRKGNYSRDHARVHSTSMQKCVNYVSGQNSLLIFNVFCDTQIKGADLKLMVSNRGHCFPSGRVRRVSSFVMRTWSWAWPRGGAEPRAMPLTGVTVMALKAAAKVIPFCMLSRGRSQTSPQGPRSGAPAPGPSLRGTVPTGRQVCQLCAEGTWELLSRAVDGRWPVPRASQALAACVGEGRPGPGGYAAPRG